MRKNNLGAIREESAASRKIAMFALVFSITSLGISAATLFLVLN